MFIWDNTRERMGGCMASVLGALNTHSICNSTSPPPHPFWSIVSFASSPSSHIRTWHAISKEEATEPCSRQSYASDRLIKEKPYPAPCPPAPPPPFGQPLTPDCSPSAPHCLLLASCFLFLASCSLPLASCFLCPTRSPTKDTDILTELNS